MRRRLGLLFPLLLVAACSGREATSPTSPATAGEVPLAAPRVSRDQTACTSSNIDALIVELVPQNQQGVAQAFLTRIRARLAGGDVTGAQGTTYTLISFLLDLQSQGLITDKAKLQQLINQLLCQAGIPLPPIDLPNNGGAGVVTPNSPTVTVTTQDATSGVVIPPGSVTQPTLITITPLPNNNPLNTDLDQYPLFYEFASTAGGTFAGQVTVGVCVPSTLSPTVQNRLLLAHNIGPNRGDVEVLPRVAAPFLNCANAFGARRGPEGIFFAGLRSLKRGLAQHLLPTPAYAATSSVLFEGSGLGGLSSSFSPYGAVDTGSVEAVIKGPSSFAARTGSTVAPTILLRKIATAAQNPGSPARGIDVTFKVTQGGGIITPVSVRSGNDGLASTAWALDVGPNTLIAEAVNGRVTPGRVTTTKVPGTPLTFTGQGRGAGPFSWGANFRADIDGLEGGRDDEGDDDDDFRKWYGSPFGTVPLGNSCSLLVAGTNTPWAPTQSLRLWRSFTPANGATSATLSVAAQGKFRIKVNGQTLRLAFDENGLGVQADNRGFFTRTGCPTRGALRFPLVRLSRLANLITVTGTSSGPGAYFDASIR